MKFSNTFSHVFLIGLFSTASLAQPWSQGNLQKLNRLVQQSNQSTENGRNDQAAAAFRQGRDYIEDGKWKEAEKALQRFLQENPQHKNRDAALYWLAFAKKKQTQFPEALAYLEQLAAQYPQSSWRDDAESLWVEMAPAFAPLAVPGRPLAVARVPQVTRVQVPEVIVRTPMAPEVNIAGVGVAVSPRVQVTFPDFYSGAFPLGAATLAPASTADLAGFFDDKSEPANEKEELKGIALQSLMRAEPERGLTYVVDILKSDKTSKYLKDTAIRLLGQYNGPKTTPYLIDFARGAYDIKLRRHAIFWLGHSKDDKVIEVLEDLITTSKDQEIAKAALFALSQRRDARSRSFLYGIASGGQFKMLQNDAILRLGSWGDDAAVDDLIKIYDASNEPEVKKRVIQSLGQHPGARAQAKLLAIARNGGADELRLQAVRYLSLRQTEAQLDEVFKLYDDEKNPSVRKQLILGLAQNRNPKVTEKIRAIALNEKDLSVRLQAIFWLGQRGEDNVNELIRLYDTENNEQVKAQIIAALSQSKSKVASQKIHQIAKSDSSITLRKRALMLIGERRDPETTKLLEEILK